MRARDLIREICMAREVTIVRGSVSPDHVHLLVSAPPKLAPVEDCAVCEGALLEEAAGGVRGAAPRSYWGQHLWARGYFCATVGAVDEETIKRYIEEQRWEDDGGDGFKVVGPPEA